MAKITKTHSSDSTLRALAQLKGLNSRLVLIDEESDLSVYDHIVNDEIHLTKEEKEGLLNSGISEEDLKKIVDLIDKKPDEEYIANELLKIIELIEQKADADHEHADDETFYITASQVLEELDRKFLSGSEKTALSGVSGNIQIKLNSIESKMGKFLTNKGIYESYAAMLNANREPVKEDIVFILRDEKDYNFRTIYIHDGKGWAKVFSSNIESLSASVITETTNKKFLNEEQKNIVAEMGVHEITGSLTFKGAVIGGSSAGINDNVISEITSYSSSKTEELLSLKQPMFKYTPENISNREKANGYAGLDSAGLIQLSRLPKEALHRIHMVMNADRRLALTGTVIPGDCAYETSTGRLYIKLNTTSTTLEDHWSYLADSYKLNQTVVNRLNATTSPTEKDDRSAGYSVGSIWVDTIKKSSYICTSDEKDLAIWDLMGGQITLSASEVIPFLYDSTREGGHDGQTEFLLPKYVEGKSIIDVFVNGGKLIENEDYVIIKGSTADTYYLELAEAINLADTVSGNVYQMGSAVSDYMTKSIYDSDQDGIVDKSKVSFSTEALLPWESGRLYSTNQLVINEGAVYRATSDFKSELEMDMANWELIKAEPYSLENYTTDDLQESPDKLFLSKAQKDNVLKFSKTLTDVDDLKSQANNADTRISTLRSYVTNDTSASNTLVNSGLMNKRFSDLKFKDLSDVPKTYVKDAFVKINSTNTGIEYASSPRFPIMEVTDRRGESYKDIYNLKIENFEKKTFEDGILTIEPKIRSSELLDMPEISINGGILVSNKNSSSYELVESSLLTMSQENKTKIIRESDWVEITSDLYQFEYTHDLSSEALVISFTDSEKEQLLDVTYKVIDASNIVFKTKNKQLVNVTMNCSLGVTNGYWSHLFDFSKISFVNDVEVRIDKSYSSDKIEKLIAPLAQKSNVFTKQEVTNAFALKTSEHMHSNLSVLNKFKEDTEGNITYSGKALLTNVKGRILSYSYDLNFEELTEIINVNSIMQAEDINSILSTEIVIQNTSEDKLELVVKDGDIILISEHILGNEVQKYSLGISSYTKIYTKGLGKVNYHMSIL